MDHHLITIFFDIVIVGVGYYAGKVNSPSTRAAIYGVLFLFKTVKFFLDNHPHGKMLAQTTNIDEQLQEFQEKHLEPHIEPQLMTEEEAGGVG